MYTPFIHRAWSSISYSTHTASRPRKHAMQTKETDNLRKWQYCSDCLQQATDLNTIGEFLAKMSLPIGNVFGKIPFPLLFRRGTVKLFMFT